MRHDDMAPAIFTNDILLDALISYASAAKGVGRELATLPAENGWTPDSPFDHDGFMAVVDAGVAAAKHHAKLNKLFFNTEKLEDNVLDVLAANFHQGWDDQRALMTKAGMELPVLEEA